MFAGGFTLEAAEAVCGLDALDGIAALVEHSLLTSRDGRFAMLETVREYAHDLLEAGGGLDDARARPRAALRRASSRTPRAGWRAPTIGEWLDRLDAERDNVRAAIAFAVADGDAAVALVLCAAVWRYWIWRGSLVEGRELVTAALALRRRAARAAPAGAQRRRRAGRRAGRLRRARRSCSRRASSWRASSATATAPRASGSNLGTLALYAADFDAAIAHYARVDRRTCARSTTRARSAWWCRTSGSPTTAPATTSRRSSC